MKALTKALATVALAALVFVLGTAQADAAYALQLSDGVNTVVVNDQGAGDLNATVGVVTFSGSLGGTSIFTINVTTGIGQPPLVGTPPNMDLNSVNVVTSGAGVLTIDFTQTDWALAAPVSVKAQAGGTASGGASSVSFEGYYDDANGLFGGTQFVALGPFGSGAYAGTSSGTIAGVTSPFSINMRAILTFTGGGSASFDYELIPEPASVMLLGLGLLGVGALRRRRA